MPAPTPQDLERLLAPIAGDAPTGASLRHQGFYDKIREARREDDASIPQGVWTRPLKTADWNAVVALATEALEQRSKDLQVAAWLADAWAQVHGIVGVTRGLELTAGLLERFWEGLFPEIDDGDEEPRVRLLEWLDDALVRRLRGTRLGDERGSILYGDWERSGTVPAAALEDEARSAADAPPTREALMARMSMVSVARWAALHAEIGAALVAARAIAQIVDARTSFSPPRRIEDVLRGMEALCAEALEAGGGAPQDRSTAVGDEHQGPEGTVAGSAASPAPGASGPITSRAEAYQRLMDAADFLLRTEPHSPVPYLVKRAIAWGNMPLTALLEEFISGSDDLVTTHRLLGMRSRGE